MAGEGMTSHFGAKAHEGRWTGCNRTSYVGVAAGVDGPGPTFNVVGGPDKTL